ncbi:hypothetical protein HYALB_00008325 [Hymenoscyphus albidus]|uniref:Uncharacterized protein n=1 Tax=Hymenoscyphus albidus TaxID=595503 RepID=A0A9N9LCV1_9HELO|nr:hypothetical protein HYALB_00008325 [Hymenoscyphus albidus]
MFVYSLLLLVGQLSLVAAQALPFTFTGFIESASPNSGSAANRGGTVKISGYTITIPDNLLVEFPAAIVPFAEFSEGNKPGQNEVTVTGNVVNDNFIAGQMTYNQVDAAFASGVIKSLGFDGSIVIENGPTLRINDPNAKYSAGFDSIPLFTADDENPSITSFSGFPVCVPRSANDPKCPSANRPPAGSRVISDALHMAPLKVGDYIEYSGIQFGGQTIVYNLVANIDITTSGSQPGFIRVEDAIIGVANADPNVEAARAKFTGLASRSDLLVRIFAIDEDPCTGEVVDRLLTTTTPDGAARNKWKVEIARGTNIGLYTRNYRIKIGDTTTQTTDGILAGQYVQPVTEWIFPELVTPGGAPPPNDFSNIGPLANGFGFVDGVLFGQLKPWPGSNAPVPAKTNCQPPSATTSTAPTSTDPIQIKADAGADVKALGGVSLLLTAKQTGDNVPDSSLTYAWTQLPGSPTVTLTNANTANARITLPKLSGASVPRTFQVVITHTPSGTKTNDTVIITSFAPSNNVFDHPVIDSLTWASRQSGSATAAAHSDLVDATATMTIRFSSETTERQMTRGVVGEGVVSYSFPAVGARITIPRYTSATIRSYLGGAAVGGPVVVSSNVG